MKRLSVLVMILFVSACSDGQTEQSEADSQEETASTEEQSDDELTELEKENEELRKELAEREKEEAEENAASEADKAEDSEDETASQNDPDDSEKSAAVEEETAELAVQEFTMEEQQEMTQHFYDWAIERAEIGNMAVTNMYFSHGAAGRGDWYAMTPDGEVQTQNQDNPGFDHFDIHAVGGVAFYQPASGDFGEDANAPVPSTAEGYSRLALPDTNIHKYMLADNGVVYELIGKREQMSFSSGFGEYDDEGTYGEFPPGVEFEISGDQDAQQEWKRILGMYQR
ncbi:hypothetical protein AALF85_05795 [Jeotgalicoccus halotolerans]|uniref:hypothetical protein n=1 Tax=Jeotgalicoccus halotolerans TaxID=157227 RepID=UPI003518EA0C